MYILFQKSLPQKSGKYSMLITATQLLFMVFIFQPASYQDLNIHQASNDCSCLQVFLEKGNAMTFI
jgi:hypothetical protein